MASIFTEAVELGMPDLGWLLDKLTSVAPNWITFGLYLSVKYVDLKIIEKDNKESCVDCLRETLAVWLSRKPTAEQLLKALNKLREKELSETLQQSLSRGEHKKG